MISGSIGRVGRIGCVVWAGVVVGGLLGAPGDGRAQSRLALAFEEAWRLSDSDPAYLVGVPAGATRDDDGNVYLLDRQQQTVWVFDPDGALLRRIGRPGEGPGDIADDPRSLAWSPTGELLVLERSPARILRFTPDGRFVDRQVCPGGDRRSLGWELRTCGSGLVLKRSGIDRDARSTTNHFSLVKLDPAGSRQLATYETKSIRKDRQRIELDEIEDYFLRAWDVAPDGHVYAAEHYDRYEITVFDPSGGIGSIRIPYEHNRRPREEIERLRAARTPRRDPACRTCPEVSVHVAPFDPDVVDLRVGPGGDLHVLTSRGAYDAPSGAFQEWDVLDPRTESVREIVRVELDADPRADRVFWLADDEVLVCRGWYDTVMTVTGRRGRSSHAATEGIDIVLSRGHLERR